MRMKIPAPGNVLLVVRVWIADCVMHCAPQAPSSEKMKEWANLKEVQIPQDVLAVGSVKVAVPAASGS